MRGLKIVALGAALAAPVPAMAGLFSLPDAAFDAGTVKTEALQAESVARQVDGSVSMRGVNISAGARELTVDALIIGVDGVVTMAQGAVDRLSENTGTIHFAKAQFASAEKAEAFAQQPYCSPFEVTADQVEQMGEATFYGVEFTGPGNVLTAPGVQSPEKIHIDDVKMKLSHGNSPDCIYLTDIDFRNLNFIGSDSTRGSAVDVSLRMDLFPDTESPLFVELNINDFSSHNEAGDKLIEIEKLRFLTSLDRETLLAGDQLDPVTDLEAQTLKLVRGMRGELSYSVAGLDMPIAPMMPQGVTLPITVNPDDRLAGSATTSIVFNKGAITFKSEQDLENLGSSLLQLDLLVSEENSGMSLDGMFPLSNLAGHIQLVGAAFKFEDRGFIDRALAAAGETQAGVVKRIGGKASAFPPAVAKPLMAWIEQSLAEGSADVTIKPAKPRPLFEIGMGMMMAPEITIEGLNIQ